MGFKTISYLLDDKGNFLLHFSINDADKFNKPLST